MSLTLKPRQINMLNTNNRITVFFVKISRFADKLISKPLCTSDVDL